MRPSRLWATATLLLMLLLLSTAAASAEIKPVTDGPPTAPIQADTGRLIVELASPPLAAVYRTQVQGAAVAGKLEVSAPDAQAYIAQLQAEQAAFVSQMQAVLPDARVSTFTNEQGAHETLNYAIVFNGLTVEPGVAGSDAARAILARLPGVKAVYPDRMYTTHLYTSTALINAPAVWDAVGGRANGGAGVKVASVDGGLHRDAPMFSGAGYVYPNGYGPNGRGLTSNNNGKIIVSRTYFRDWDPPAAGDQNPWPGVNGTSHGVHTGSIAAGNVVSNVTYAGFNVGTMSGVAPRAYVMSYRVFYPSVNGNESSYTAETLAALEDVVADGADVVNNSWGEGPISEGGDFDPVDTALINTWNAGVFVSLSAGHAGPGLGTTDHPSPDYIKVAASTTSGTLAAGRLSVTGAVTLTDMAFGTADFGPPLTIGQVITFPFVTAASVDAGNVTGCDPFPAGAFTGVAAVISRGTCSFSDKVYNAQQAGASFVVIYNNQGGDAILNMGCATHCAAGEIVISSVLVSQNNGQGILQWFAAEGPSNSVFQVNTVAFQLGNVPDRIIDFSSRGPGVGSVLSPDIAAPGVNILAQGYTPGVTGEARHLGYGQVSGTSMASPHVAGAAALLRQAYPYWTNASIKSALMSTARYTEVYNLDGSPAQPLDMGAGRLDLTRVLDPGVILNPPDVSFGQVPTGTQELLTFQVTNITGAAETYSVATLYTGAGFAPTQTTTLPGFTVTPASITLAPGETRTLSVTLDTAASAGLGDNQGYIVLTGATHQAHLPVWARVMHATPLGDVLIIDNDFSDGNQPYDYLWYYTSTVEALGLSYAIVNVDDSIGQPTTIPDATELAAYRAIVWFTGDNYQPNGTFAVATGLTQLDQDRLVEYLNGGGLLIAMGQDLAATLDADAFNPPVSDRNFLYAYRLGANWVQDSVSNDQTPNAFIYSATDVPAALQDIVVDLTQVRKYVDTGVLTGAEEVPPNGSATTGSFNIQYDVDQNRLNYAVTVIPTVTTPITVTAAHIHTGTAGTNGPVIRDLFTQTVFVTSSLSFAGTIDDLTPAEQAQMLDGGLYINVHSTDFPGGEVRGQILPTARPNQPYVDEVANRFYDGSQDPNPTPGTSESNLASIPILRYAGPFNIVDGTVTLAHRDQPSLERPGIDYRGSSVYASFGLEGMNETLNPTLTFTPTTRAELLARFLRWGWSVQGAATISDTTPLSPTGTTFIAAVYTPPITGTTASRYRWDFGDGTPYIVSAGNAASHSYVCAANNVYTVRVEITDSYGNVAIGSRQVDVSSSCTTETWVLKMWLPWIRRQ